MPSLSTAVRFCIDAKLTSVLVIVAAIFGAFALWVTPREENPRIAVPYAIVTTAYAGHDRNDTERLVTIPLERAIEQTPNVEHRYATTTMGRSSITVRFRVGTPTETAYVDLQTRLDAARDALPAAVDAPRVQRLDIDDLPVLVLTLASRTDDGVRLRKLAQTIADRLAPLAGVGNVTLFGGSIPAARIDVIPERLAAFGLGFADVSRTLATTNVRTDAGFLNDDTRHVEIRVGAPFVAIDDVAKAVVRRSGGAPVRLGELATIAFAPETPVSYHEHAERAHPPETAVSIAVAKYAGSDAGAVTTAALAAAGALPLPSGVTLHVMRDDGAKADAAVGTLFERLGEAIVIVSLLLVIALGRREALIVALTIPLTLAVTLVVGMLLHQTINRITLFALILALGLLVDDAIVVIENIHRVRAEGGDLRDAVVRAVVQVAAPTILATVTVILAFLPMAFVTGLMGPYMRPIPLNVPIAMVVSLIVALFVTPWAAVRVLGPLRKPARARRRARLRTAIESTVERLIDKKRARNLAFGALVVALLAAFALPLTTAVRFRMLPSQNETTFLVTLDLPAGTGLATTRSVAQALARDLLADGDVRNVDLSVGAHAVPDFNALLQDLLARDAAWQADLRVNLVDPHDRTRASDAVVRALRPVLVRTAAASGGTVKLVEEPPGPPVRATVLAEITGPDRAERARLATRVASLVRAESGVVDVDDTVKRPAPRVDVVVDPMRAALLGMTPEDVGSELQAAYAGLTVGTLHDAGSADPLPVILREIDRRRTGRASLQRTVLAGPAGAPIALASLATFASRLDESPAVREDGVPLEYVTAEMSGRSSTYAVIDLLFALRNERLPAGYGVRWDGEWQLTLDVFRDLGIAMGVAIVLIFLVLVARFRSLRIPLIILSAVPLGLIGVLPGFALLAPRGVYFSATAMIGVIALAGIVVRNAIVLVEFIEASIACGTTPRDAAIAAAGTRARPIALTALAGMLSALVIAPDPVWSGLAWTLIFGMGTSAALSLLVVPVLYARAVGGYTRASHASSAAVVASDRSIIGK